MGSDKVGSEDENGTSQGDENEADARTEHNRDGHAGSTSHRENTSETSQYPAWRTSDMQRRSSLPVSVDSMATSISKNYRRCASSEVTEMSYRSWKTVKQCLTSQMPPEATLLPVSLMTLRLP